MADILTGILMGMTISLALAIVMERMLFRGLLSLMFRGPRWVKVAVAQPIRPRLTAIRKAGL
jgi:hypothetical protein